VKETSLLHSGQSNFTVALGIISQSSACGLTSRKMNSTYQSITCDAASRCSLIRSKLSAISLRRRR
jgi:hypothetical protein